MLVPKGLPGGLRCELFVMISDYEQDRVRVEFVPEIVGARLTVYVHRSRSIRIWLAYATMQHRFVVSVIVCILTCVPWASHSIGWHAPELTGCRTS